MRALLLACLAIPAAAPAAAEDLSAYGTTNPEEMTLGRMVENAEAGRTDMATCAAGYLMTKSGAHGAARATFEACAAAGYTRAMTWMSYLDDNGYGGESSPAGSAEWNRRAAEAGDPVGMLNHGLDLLRGHGAPLDAPAGRALVDRAAAAGVEEARLLQAAGYDPAAVTPDADEWKYAPRS